MAVPVNFYIKDTSLSPQPIQGVVVNIYNATTLAFITGGTTNVLGAAAFLLPGTGLGQAYEVRLFKSGVSFSNPLTITVLEPVTPPNSNDFDVSGTVYTLPTATDPRLCRCTGQFIGLNGAPVNNTLVRVMAILGAGSLTPQATTPDLPPELVEPPPNPPTLLSGFQVPKVLDGKMVASDTLEARTDANGRVSIDLIRNGQYFACFAGEEDVLWRFTVPDRASVNLVDLIHPAPSTLTWNSSDAPGNVVSVAVGATVNVRFGILFTNYLTYSKNLGFLISFTNSDDAILSVLYDAANGQLTLTGKSAGVSSITTSILPNMTPARIPDYSLVAPALAVTVTP